MCSVYHSIVRDWSIKSQFYDQSQTTDTLLRVNVNAFDPLRLLPVLLSHLWIGSKVMATSAVSEDSIKLANKNERQKGRAEKKGARNLDC